MAAHIFHLSNAIHIQHAFDSAISISWALKYYFIDACNLLKFHYSIVGWKRRFGRNCHSVTNIPLGVWSTFFDLWAQRTNWMSVWIVLSRVWTMRFPQLTDANATNVFDSSIGCSTNENHQMLRKYQGHTGNIQSRIHFRFQSLLIIFKLVVK